MSRTSPDRHPIARVLREHRLLLDRFEAEGGIDAVEKAGARIVSTLGSGGTVFVCGNGGSAADAQHLCAEIVGRFVRKDRDALPALALTVDTSAITAIANDWGFEHVFERQLRGLLRAGDCLIGITTSGRSPNVLRAMKYAQDSGAATIGLVGNMGADMAPLSDVVILVPHAETARVQEVHQLIYHAWCEQIDAAFSPRPG